MAAVSLLQRLPAYIMAVLTALGTAGYPAYIVGGAVRDLMRGKEPEDYDITTAARPEEVQAVAAKAGWKVVDKLGHNFGVVLAVVQGHKVEIATFRGERYGADSHRPEAVWYADSLEADLSRRDFTINALALAADGTLVDCYHGHRDMEAGCIRAVGDAGIRFAEDGLRMFRACRFAAQLGFRVEAQTLAAIGLNLDRTAGLSLERVRAELDKLLLAPHVAAGLDVLVRSGLAAASCRTRFRGGEEAVPILPELIHLVDMPQNPLFHRYDCWQHTLETVRCCPPEPVLRWAALLHDVAKGLPGIRGLGKTGQPTDYGHDSAGAEIACHVLKRLQLPEMLCKRVVWLVAQHMRFHFHAHSNDNSGEKPAAVVRWVREEARSGLFRTTGELTEAFEQLVDLSRADMLASGRAEGIQSTTEGFGLQLLDIVQSMPVHTTDVAYDAELLSLLRGPQDMGPFLRNVLRRIQDGNLTNEWQAVREAACRWLIRQQRKE